MMKKMKRSNGMIEQAGDVPQASRTYLVDSAESLNAHFTKRKGVKVSAVDMNYYGTASERVLYAVFGRTAVITVRGVMEYSESFWSRVFGDTTYQALARNLSHAEQNDSIDDAILLFDSPGGDVAGISVAVEALKDFSKPIVSRVEGMCASAAYYLACLTDEIHSYRLGLIGSVGVMVIATNWESEEAKQYVKVVRSSGAKNKNSTDETVVREFLDEIEDVMFEDVGLGRGWKASEVGKKTGNGKMYSGVVALEMGLIDGLLEKSQENSIKNLDTQSIACYNENEFQGNRGTKPMSKMFFNRDKATVEKGSDDTPPTTGASSTEIDAAVQAERFRCTSLAKICKDNAKLVSFIHSGTDAGNAAIALLSDKAGAQEPSQTEKEETITMTKTELERIKLQSREEKVDEDTADALAGASAAAQGAEDSEVSKIVQGVKDRVGSK